MIKIYRISDKGNSITLPGITRQICLDNFLTQFNNDKVYIIADNVEDATYDNLSKLDVTLIRQNKGNSGALKTAFELAMTFDDDEIVYFCEDDFLHKENPEQYLLEGLSIADYVSLYDHSDKYMTPGPNPYVKHGGEHTIVRLTKSTHWKYTNSTVQTFAAKVKTLKEDKELLYKYNFESSTPDSFKTFISLINNGRTVATCIPGRSTHCVFMSPLTDWTTYAKHITADIPQT